MVYLFMQASVEDFDKWQKALKDFMPILNQMGSTNTSVYQEIGSPKNVTVIHEFPSKEKAEAFVNSTELHDSRKEAEVIGTPKIWYTEKL
ncbi:DUF1330 domain-containing protein [Microbulbifer variabilis]|uniref:DUF1330 domain-containing protein n=1 Tax=Microbulbifer variabilis TaxID=266805 RepID=UPI001CFDDA82|nr:DUF1330 domain-containing protein [Microbulbifer variabilis]